MFTGKVESQSAGDDIFIDGCTVLSITLKWSHVILNHLTRKILYGEFAESAVLFLFSFVLWCFIFERTKITLKVGSSGNTCWAFLNLLGVSANQILILLYNLPLQDAHSGLVWLWCWVLPFMLHGGSVCTQVETEYDNNLSLTNNVSLTENKSTKHSCYLSAFWTRLKFLRNLFVSGPNGEIKAT